MKRLALIAGLVVIPLAALAIPLTTPMIDGCPTVEALQAYEPPEASQLLARDGSLIADLSPQRRRVVPLERIPEHLSAGFIAVEDRRFWRHGGVDFRSMGRALWRDLRSLSFREGFSTIQMQLARNVFPDELPRAKELGRKVCEIHLARRMQKELAREEILELYLNQIYLGDGRYGVEAAALGYFGKSASEISPAESALLIALAKSPEGYNPRRHPELARERRDLVLSVLAREGVLSVEEAQAAAESEIALVSPEVPASAPYLVSAARRELHARFGPDAEIRGLRIYTGVDPELQHSARDALLAGIDRVERGEYGPYPYPRPSTKEADRFSPDRYLQGLVVVLDPESGEIRALVGGRDFGLSQFDRALQARRQPGSAFKPFIYAAALERGIPITTQVSTAPVALEDQLGEGWYPSDHLPDSISALPFRAALARSSNLAAVRVGEWVGVERVTELANDAGISTPIPPYPSTFLGSAEVVPVELVAAYAIFGNGGHRVRPHLITRVEDREGKLLWQVDEGRERVLDEGAAYLTLSLLRDVIDQGTGSGARAGGYVGPAAGKTGTTNEGKDLWFIGLTPDLVAGVWLGFDRPAPIVPQASGGKIAAPIWGDLMGRNYAKRAPDGVWTPPSSLEEIEIDYHSGFLATGKCPPEGVGPEYFLSGTGPTEYCPLHPESGVTRFLDRLWGRVRRLF